MASGSPLPVARAAHRDGVERNLLQGRVGSWVVPLALGVFALVVRAYRLSANPLWLDEIGGLQLARLGVPAILANSGLDPHPPGYYLWLWATTFGGAWSSEWALRWSSVLFGALTVPLVYQLARRYTQAAPAALAAVLLALSPAHLYYSQEARSPAMLGLIAAATAWLLEARHWPGRRRWPLYTALNLLGGCLGYSYAMVMLVQGLWIIATERRSRGARWALGVSAVGVLPLIFSAARTLPTMGEEGMSVLLNASGLLGALLAGELARYGAYWGHRWLPVVLGGLALLGVWGFGRAGARRGLYYPTQVLLPVVGFFFLLGPLVGIQLPLYQSRQFIPLLPAWYVSIAAGLEVIWTAASAAPVRAPRALPMAAALGLTGLALYASGVGIGRYWAITKSPEGELARYVRAHVQPEDTVISLHYSLDGAFSAYPVDNRLYTKPLGPLPDTRFSTSLSITRAGWFTIERPYSLEQVAQSPRRWVVWLAGENDDLAATLAAGCVVRDQATFGGFQAQALERCPVSEATPTPP